MKTLIVVHYAEPPFKLRPICIKNGYNKPRGGLWVSPLRSKHSWARWCKKNMYMEVNKKEKVLMEIATDRIVVIDSTKDLNKLHWTKKSGLDIIDFVRIKEEYYGIYLTKKGERETHGDADKNLYGWDCESIVLLDDRCIRKILSEGIPAGVGGPRLPEHLK